MKVRGDYIRRGLRENDGRLIIVFRRNKKCPFSTHSKI